MYVAFNDTERLVGDAAKNQANMNPTNVYDAKQLIGRKFNDQIVQNDIKNLPYTVENENDKPVIKVSYKNE